MSGLESAWLQQLLICLIQAATLFTEVEGASLLELVKPEDELKDVILGQCRRQSDGLI